MVVVATLWSVNGNDSDIICRVSRKVEVPSNRFVTLVFSVTAVLQQSGLQHTFRFADILLIAFPAVDQVHYVDRGAGQVVSDGESLTGHCAGEYCSWDCMLDFG